MEQQVYSCVDALLNIRKNVKGNKDQINKAIQYVRKLETQQENKKNKLVQPNMNVSQQEKNQIDNLDKIDQLNKQLFEKNEKINANMVQINENKKTLQQKNQILKRLELLTNEKQKKIKQQELQLRQSIQKYKQLQQKFQRKSNQKQDLIEKNQMRLNFSYQTLQKIEVSNQKKHKDQTHSYILSEGSSYDLVLKINAYQINKQIQVNFTKDYQDYINKHQDNINRVVGFTGRENVGKTFLINKLTDMKYSAGFQQHTQGICAKYDSCQSERVLFVDTEGKFKPKQCNQKEIENDSKIVQDLIQKFLLYSCDIIIFVVNHTIESEQKSINSMLINLYKGDKTKQIIIVHNYQQLKKPDQIKRHINHLLKCFPMKSQTVSLCTKDSKEYLNQNMIFYSNQSFHTNRQVFHCIFANQDSQAGIYFNRTSMIFMKQHIYNSGKSRFVDLKNQFFNFIEQYRNIKYQIKKQEKQNINELTEIYESTDTALVKQQNKPEFQLPRNINNPNQINLNYVKQLHKQLPVAFKDLTAAKKAKYQQISFMLPGPILKLLIQIQNENGINYLTIQGSKIVKIDLLQVQSAEQNFFYKFQLPTNLQKQPFTTYNISYCQKKMKTSIRNDQDYELGEKQVQYVGLFYILIPILEQKDKGKMKL